MSDSTESRITVSSYLQAEYNEAQVSLKHVEENIRRLTGRNPDELRGPVVRRTNFNVNNSTKRSFPPHQPDAKTVSEERPLKKKFIESSTDKLLTQTEDVEEDSGEEESAIKKPTVQSSVVATLKDIRSRRDTIEEQKNDAKGMARNRRMFGMILGTLHKFQHEESRRKEKTQKRVEIEQKLEAAAEKEKEDLKKERQDLYVARREKQAQLRRLEQKMQLANLYEDWDKQNKSLLHFIETKAKPHIMFLPLKHTQESQKRLKETQQKIESKIKSQHESMENELKEIDELYKKGGLDEEEEMEEEEVELSESTVNKENRGPEESAFENGKQKAVEIMDIEMKKEVSEQSEMPDDRQVTNEDDKIKSEEIMKVEPLEEEIVTSAGDKILEALGDPEFEPIYDE